MQLDKPIVASRQGQAILHLARTLTGALSTAFCVICLRTCMSGTSPDKGVKHEEGRGILSADLPVLGVEHWNESWL